VCEIKEQGHVAVISTQYFYLVVLYVSSVAVSVRDIAFRFASQDALLLFRCALAQRIFAS
jgi:hypothetical protein